MTTLFPAAIMPTLNTLAQIGVILYMFLVGLDLNAGVLPVPGALQTVAISHVGIIVPFLLGATLALWLFPTLAPADVSFTSFALFLGVRDGDHGVPGPGPDPDRPEDGDSRSWGPCPWGAWRSTTSPRGACWPSSWV